ncbi:ABC transporter substrate-binding protein [Oculatella sp. LEGE 06141]|uniref:ABC transporter substrate-binding protein n=1 Tax=Oculatella sp. LEGE 06141 TaxID=1828648 RepID=UPI0030D7052B
MIACSRQLPSNSSLTSGSPPTTDLTIWWDKGYLLEEDEALQQVIRTWEKAHNTHVKLSFYTADEIAQKALRAEQAGNPPDVLFASRAEYPLLVWEGKLADVSEVIEPVKNLYSVSVLRAIRSYNNVEQKRGYYSVPLHQATIHIFYWKDLLQQAGFTPSDIPSEWDAFWDFWKTVQDKLRSQQTFGNYSAIYGLGLPFSVGASDTYYVFEQILEANNVSLLDQRGRLLVDQPEVRAGIVTSLDWYSQLYQQGYVPPDALKWLDPDNNRSFINHEVVMTANPTLSIPNALRQDPDLYLNQLGTLPFPQKPSGQPMRHIVLVRQAMVFATSKHQQAAKDFLAYLIQPEVMETYLQSAGGRYLPVLTKAKRAAFWTDAADPHISSATKLLDAGLTRSFSNVQNPAYSMVLGQNIWGKALDRILIDRLSPDQAANEAIDQIKQIFDQWNQERQEL